MKFFKPKIEQEQQEYTCRDNFNGKCYRTLEACDSDKEQACEEYVPKSCYRNRICWEERK